MKISRPARRPRLLDLKLSAGSLPDAKILLPDRGPIRIEHTVKRVPPERPHTLAAVIMLPTGQRLTGNPFHLGNAYPSRLYLPLPGNLVFARYCRNDGSEAELQLTQLEVEAWWS